jgi:Zn-dependent protease with chaperone function
MDQGDFESLVSQMEQLAREKPKPYRRRVFLLAALGYAYLIVVVVVLLGLTAAAIASVSKIGILGGKLTAVVGVLLIAVVRGLWVRLKPPSGEVVTSADAPELFRLLNALRVRLKTAPIHVVLITPAFSAGVAQVPRFGLFGWHRNYLILGLPFMKALTVEQFKSVLAHEMGHLCHGHTRVAEFAPPAPGEGAEKLLGSSRARFEKQFDAAWNKWAAPKEARPYFQQAPSR